MVAAVQAQPRDPVVEIFRFDQEDHLIIDLGGPVDMAGDVNGDGIDDIIVGAGAGAVRVIFGPNSGFRGTINGQQLDGNSGFSILHDLENLTVLAGLGDINGDEFDDIIVGTINGTQVIFGRPGGFDRFVDINDLDGSNGFRIASAATSVSAAGDINGDGINDILLGNANASANGLTGVGITYVIYGRQTAFPADFSTASLNGNNGFAVLGTNTEDRSGFAVADAGDFNNDGIDDFLIGAPNKTQEGEAEVGEAYVIYGRRESFPAAISLADIDGNNGLIFIGSDIQDSLGSSVSGIGDINHDGYDDVAIGAPGKGPFGSPSDYPGEVYVLFGNRSLSEKNVREKDLDGENGFILRGIRGGVVPIEENEAIWGDLAGTSIDGAGDINGDGIDDLMIGASHTIINPRRKGVGQVYFVYGSESSFPERLPLSDLDGGNGFRLNGIGTTDYFGVYVRRAGDFNDDKRDDVIIGASGQSNSYVYYGTDPWAAITPAAPTPATNGTPSAGFPAIALYMTMDAQPLAFNELPDPTGPSPLPPGTSVKLGSSDTPGDIPANILEPVAPLRLTDPIPESVSNQLAPIDQIVEQASAEFSEPQQVLPIVTDEPAEPADVAPGDSTAPAQEITEAPASDVVSPTIAFDDADELDSAVVSNEAAAPTLPEPNFALPAISDLSDVDIPQADAGDQSNLVASAENSVQTENSANASTTGSSGDFVQVGSGAVLALPFLLLLSGFYRIWRSILISRVRFS